MLDVASTIFREEPQKQSELSEGGITNEQGSQLVDPLQLSV